MSHLLERDFLSDADRQGLREWLRTLVPIWENRYPDRIPMRQGQTSRRLLRPVYWLGNWQFACLHYYRPPDAVLNRCVAAEPFPDLLARIVHSIEDKARALYSGPDLPAGWKLNTCLINLYGLRRVEDRWIDSARVRAHKDFEPGPVASLSLGERALFQFRENHYPEEPGDVLEELWLEDGALQIFGGAHWKDELLHGVERVERKAGHLFEFPLADLADFRTRRINFTFRYVPDVHVIPFAALPDEAREDVRGYVETLARSSPFFKEQL